MITAANLLTGHTLLRIQRTANDVELVQPTRIIIHAGKRPSVDFILPGGGILNYDELNQTWTYYEGIMEWAVEVRAVNGKETVLDFLV